MFVKTKGRKEPEKVQAVLGTVHTQDSSHSHQFNLHEQIQELKRKGE